MESLIGFGSLWHSLALFQIHNNSSHNSLIHLTHRRFEDEGVYRGFEEFVEAFQWVLSFLPLVSLFPICVTNSILGSQCEPL